MWCLNIVTWWASKLCWSCPWISQHCKMLPLLNTTEKLQTVQFICAKCCKMKNISFIYTFSINMHCLCAYAQQWNCSKDWQYCSMHCQAFVDNCTSLLLCCMNKYMPQHIGQDAGWATRASLDDLWMITCPWCTSNQTLLKQPIIPYNTYWVITVCNVYGLIDQ